MENEILDYEENEKVDKVHDWIQYIGYLRAIVTIRYFWLFGNSVKDFVNGPTDATYVEDAFMFFIVNVPFVLMMYYNIMQTNREISLDITCYADHYLRGLAVLYFGATGISMLIDFLSKNYTIYNEYWYVYKFGGLFFALIFLVLIIMEIVYMRKPYVKYD